MSTYRTAFLGILLALMVVATTLEVVFLTPFMPPLVKLGFANIIVMFAVLAIGRKEAVILNSMKSVFVLVIRGPVAGLMSFSGGMISVLIIILLVTYLSERRASFITLGVVGAFFHNLGQISIAAWLMNFSEIIFYIPVLLVAGTIAGVITGTLLKSLMPILARVYQI